MAEFFRLRNQVKHSDWGSAHFIPALLGVPSDGKPWAEMWMGSHPALPSKVRLPGGELVGLGEFVARDASRYLGEKIAHGVCGKEPAGGPLPYLLKLLAAEKPLSIQAHPSLELAREGFARENAQGLSLCAPSRNYRDPNHKPEMVCALAPFAGMCGFREPEEIARLLAAFLDGPRGAEPAPASLRAGFSPLLRALEASPAASALRGFLSALFDFPASLRDELTRFVVSRGEGAEGTGCEWGLMRGFARQHPGDPAAIAPLYLNVFRLQPGEAIFLKPGTLHAYVSGFAVELMACSDNVLRGGLTSKRVDVPELLRALDFSPHKPRIMKPERGSPSFVYPVSCDDFSLAVMRGAGGAAAFAPDGPSVCIVTEGEASIGADALRAGESFFVPPVGASEKPLELRGTYVLYVASSGKPE